jgi:hypothetical protein
MKKVLILLVASVIAISLVLPAAPALADPKCVGEHNTVGACVDEGEPRKVTLVDICVYIVSSECTPVRVEADAPSPQVWTWCWTPDWMPPCQRP